MGRGEGDPSPLSLASLLFYPLGLVRALTAPVLAFVLWGAWRLGHDRRIARFHLVVAVTTLVIAWAAFTATWNKDLRYAVPMTFFLLPALVAVVDLARTARLRAVLMGGLTTWTLLVDLAQVTGLAPGRIALGPVVFWEGTAYTLASGPQAADTVRPAEAFAALVQMAERSGYRAPGARLPACIDLGPNNAVLNQWNWQAAQRIYRPASTPLWLEHCDRSAGLSECAHTDHGSLWLAGASGRQLLFLRDARWPDYYLFEVAEQAGGSVLRWLDSVAAIGGEVHVRIDDGVASPVDVQLQRGQPVTLGPGPTGRLHLEFRIDHSGATRWRLKLVAQLYGKRDWPRGPLLPLPPDPIDLSLPAGATSQATGQLPVEPR